MIALIIIIITIIIAADYLMGLVVSQGVCFEESPVRNPAACQKLGKVFTRETEVECS